MRSFLFFLFFSTLFGLACSSNKSLVVPIEPEYESVMLDTILVTDSAPAEEEEPNQSEIYNASATRYFDLLHTKLDLHFDWAGQKVLGIAELELQPLFYPQDSLVLDAKGLKINNIYWKITQQKLNYKNNGFNLVIYLGRKYQKNEKIGIVIDYVASPK